MFADESLYALQSLDSTKTLQQLLDEARPALRDAFVGSLRPKEYHCQQIGNHCRRRLATWPTPFYILPAGQKPLSKMHAELQGAAEYLCNARLTVLHTLVNITKQPFKTGTVEVSQSDSSRFAAESCREKESSACMCFTWLLITSCRVMHDAFRN